MIEIGSLRVRATARLLARARGCPKGKRQKVGIAIALAGALRWYRTVAGLDAHALEQAHLETVATGRPS